MTRALRDRQTVVLSLPTDVQDARVALGNTPPRAAAGARADLHPDPAVLRELAEALARAKRPLILAGRGAVLSGAEGGIAAHGRSHSARLLATSVCGHGLFAGNPWSLGIAAASPRPWPTS